MAAFLPFYPVPPKFKIFLLLSLYFLKWFVYIPLSSHWIFNNMKDFWTQIDSKVRLTIDDASA